MFAFIRGPSLFHFMYLVITRVPVLIGAGIPLFGPVPRDITLRHVATRCYNGGLVQSEYEIEASVPMLAGEGA